MDPYYKKISIIVLTIFAGILVFIFGTVNNPDKQIGKSAEYSPPSGPAIMNNSEELYKILNDNYQFTNIREDLGVFARTTIDKYGNDGSLDVVFEVKIVESVDGVIHIKGQFLGQKQTISMQVKPLSFGQIDNSIRNESTDTSIDKVLPSNSSYNKFVGSLPLDKDDYSITYDVGDDSFVVNLYERDPSLNTPAGADISSGLGLKSLESVKVKYVLPSIYGI